MVYSRLNPSIKYVDKKKINEKDKNLNVSVYEIELIKYKIIINIAIGNDTIINNILTLPIYLIYDNKFISQIGLFEYNIYNKKESNNYYELLNNNNNIILEKVGEPLLYSFVTKEFLLPYQIIKNKKKVYNSRLWIQKLMNDDNYNLINTETEYIGGKNDCLYTALKIALSDIRIYMSVTSMKEKVIDNITNEVFHYYKNNYDDIINNIYNTKLLLKDLTDKNNFFQNEIKKTTVRNEKLNLIRYAEDNIKLFNNKKRDLVYLTKKYKKYIYMNGIDNIRNFKNIIISHSFIQDEWLISMLEKELNIKIILFSENEFSYNDIDNVIYTKTSELVDKKEYNPKYYILISYKNDKFNLITYNHRCIFTFNQLDKKIKDMIIDKIQERNGGIYEYIQDFKNYMNNNNIILKNMFDLNEKSDLYHGDTIFKIYDNAICEYEPGEGIGEKLDKSEKNNYTNLLSYNSWRKDLYDVYKYDKLDNNIDDQTLFLQISRDENIKNILLNTKNAKLVYFKPKSPPELAMKLMRIRKML